MNNAINIAKQIELRLSQDGMPRKFRIANHTVVTDVEETTLGSYRVPGPAMWSHRWEEQRVPDDKAKPIYSGPGWIGRTWRHVICQPAQSGYALEIERIASYLVEGDGSYIQQTSFNPTSTRDLLAQTALGAPLVLALALRQTFCLHGSAVTLDNRFVLFVGESGAGKSTLAAHLARKGGEQQQRVIDDTLPVRFEKDGCLLTMPHFPQLKIAANEQPVHLVPEIEKLHAIYVLRHQDSAVSNGLSISDLPDREAAVMLIQHTVGSRLFPADLLASHLTFCGQLAATVPVRALSFPHDWGKLPEIEALLQSDLARIT